MRIIFAGTPEFAAHHLNVLLTYGYQIVGVFTRLDSSTGRGMKIIPTPVKILAKKYNLSVFQPTSLCSPEIQQLIVKLNADIMVVVAYGLIIPKEVLEIPRFGCINVHCSLLPRWRGPAPVQRSICAGDIETGITIIQMNTSLDAGDILYKLSCTIDRTDTSRTLYNKLAKLGSIGLIETLERIFKNDLHPEKQDETQVSYAKKLSKREARIDWSMFAVQLERCIRAFNPWPISWLEVNGQLIKVLKASVIDTDDNNKMIPGTIIEINKHGIQISTTRDILNLELLQPAGKRIMSALDFLNSRRKWFSPGNRLS